MGLVTRSDWSTPAQMFDHELNPVKGWPSPYALDKSKGIKAGVTGIVPGRVCSIDPGTDAIVLGCPASATVAQMPLFAFPGQTDLDVIGDTGNISGGHMVFLVATGAYELESTEYNAGTYTPGIPLAVDNTIGATLGKLKATVMNGGLCVVGIISDSGPLTNDFGKTVIRFWSCFLPVHS